MKHTMATRAKKAAKGCDRTGSSGSSQELWPTPFLSWRVHASNTAMAGKDETKSEYADLIARLHDIGTPVASASFDGERRVDEPYFADTEDLPRLSFAEAARQYGMHELPCGCRCDAESC